MAGTFPRDPFLIPLFCLDAIIVWLVVSSAASGHGWPPSLLLFFALLVVVPLVFVVGTGAWVSERSIMIRIMLGRRIYRFDQVAGITYAKSRWTNCIRVLSLVTTSGDVVPIPGWPLRTDAGDREAIRRMELAIRADSKGWFVRI